MRVMLADDAILVRQGLARLLEDAGFGVVAQMADATELLSSVDIRRSDVVIVDIRMPPSHTTEGLQAGLEIKACHPHVGVLVLSQHLESRLAFKLLGGGRPGVGYLLKERVATWPSSPTPFAGWPVGARPSIARSPSASLAASVGGIPSTTFLPASARFWA